MEGKKGSWACFVVIALVITVSFSMSSCATVTATAVPIPSHPALTLISPASEATIIGEQRVEFSWHWDGVLQEGERLDLRIWRYGKPCDSVAMWSEDKHSYFLDTPPDGFGHYLWQVAVVRIDESDNKLILCESLIWSFVWSDVPPTFTPTGTPTATPVSPTATSTPPTVTKTVPQTLVPPTATVSHTPRPLATPPLTATATDVLISPKPTPSPTAVPIILTIYLRLTETNFVALSGDQVGEIYKEGKCVYGEAAVQIGETTYHFDKPKVEPGEPEQLPDPWWVEFEFARELKDRTTTAEGDGCAEGMPGFNDKKAQFWVGILDDHSAVGEDNPYSLTMTLYGRDDKGNEVRESIQVFFIVADAPESPGGGGSFWRP